MGGIAKGATKTWNTVVPATKRIFTGKANIKDVGNAVFSDIFSQGANTLKRVGEPDAPPAASPYGDAFTFDPQQTAADQQSINDLADRQYSDAQNFRGADQVERASARQRLADALTKQSQAYFQQGVPETEEVLNSQHLLNGSGLGQELARQQGNLATNIANQVGVQGSNDINQSSQMALQALYGRQQQQAAALSRGLSLQDFARQAQVAKAIGAQAAPQVGNGKGSMVAGAGAGAQAGSYFGPWGAAIGGIAGGALGSQAR